MMAQYLPIPGDAPEAVRALATQLRDAKEAAGLSVAQLARKAHFSTATISLAASGKKVPTWAVTWAYVEACEDDKGQGHWEALWAAADAAEKGQTDGETVAADPSPTSESKRSRTPRKSVNELVDEAVNRLRLDGASPELDRTRSRLELCISAEQFCDLLRGARGSRSSGEIKERARSQGFTIRKFDVVTMTSENYNTVPDIDTLHAFLMGCEVEPGILQLWVNTATRLRLMQAWHAEPHDEMGLGRRVKRRLGPSLGGLRFDAFLTLVCTLILTSAQVYYLIR
ncbi:helix-turn-helix domain-containing protein [Streptomyces acidicola]|uniref:helix-turn-helix domain-containing protein n=1 Tax=Streptomyces acidicola TaxID=2596892 RepID=UPI00342C77A3